MKEKQIIVPLQIATFDELDNDTAKLVELAKDATYRAYSPYSKFNVGAAILLDNGEIVTGSNQENVAYPSGTCAERTACFYAHSQFPSANFTAIAIAARDTSGSFIKSPISPCGSCRQALLEYEILAQKNVPVYLVGQTDIYILPSIKALLPLAFSEF